jgi:predicted TIM-barrel fold metal-dependent hydrolase
MHGKIAFEEHFNLPQFEIPEYADAATMREIRRRLLDVSEQRLADMDATGIDYAIQSLVSPDLQSETDAKHAVSAAKKVNDTLAEIVATHQPRYGGFAILPLLSRNDGQWFHQPRRRRNRLVLRRSAIPPVLGTRRSPRCAGLPAPA